MRVERRWAWVVMLMVCGRARADECATLGAVSLRPPGFAKLDCAGLDPKTVDIMQTVREMQECALPDGIEVKASFREGDQFNPSVVLSRGVESIREFVLEPRTKIQARGFGIGAKLSCDSEGRFYVLQSIMGYLAAFDRRGERLWLRQLPDFVRLDDVMPAGSADLDGVRRALKSTASLGSQVRVSGDYVAVEYRTAGAGTTHLIYHRSGYKIGQLGPWDGRILEPNALGWRFVAGGGPDVRFYVPRVRIDLQVTDTKIASLIDHALAWLQPRPIDRELKFGCLARADDEIKFWLGDAFDLEQAKLAKALLLPLEQQDWFKHLVESPYLAESRQKFDPTSAEWRAAYTQALLDAGVDVKLVEQAREGASRLLRPKKPVGAR